MKRIAGCVAALLTAAAGLSACTVPGGWMGADAEKAYEQELKLKRTAEALNNDDYYEIHHEGRIYAFSDYGPYQIWRQTGEVPLVVTQIGSGPGGETVKLQLNKTEAKAMEKTVGYKGAAQRLFEGELVGLESGFYGEILRPERIWVFSSGEDLRDFRAAGHVACGLTQIGAGPDGRTVVFAQSCKAAGKGQPAAAIARFKKNYDLP